MTLQSAGTRPDEAEAGRARDGFDEISHALTLVLRSGKTAAYASELEATIRAKDAEIETLCNLHYQNFVQSVDELLLLRTSASELRRKLSVLHGDLQAAGQSLIARKRELIAQKRMLLQMEDASDTMQGCIAVLEQWGRIEKQIAGRKFYAALRMLADLQKNQLARVSRFSFAQRLLADIPQLRERVRAQVLRELKDWLVQVRESCRQIGHLAIAETQAQYEREQAQFQSESTTGTGPLRPAAGPTAAPEAADALMDQLAGFNFRPLYQCLHIHEVLGRKAEFRTQFEEIRRVHCDLWIVHSTQPGLQMDATQTAFSAAAIDAFAASLDVFLDDVAGFFVMEVAIMDSTADFRGRDAVQALWDEALRKLHALVGDVLLDRVDPDLFLRVKAALLRFARAVETFGYSAEPVVDIVFTHLQAMVHVMQQQLRGLAATVIDEDAYSPMDVADQAALDRVAGIMGCALRHVDGGRLLRSFPRTLPFSAGLCAQVEYVKKYIAMFYEFVEGFAHYYAELNDLVKKSLEAILTDYLVEPLVEKLGTSGNLSQAAQIIINLEFLEHACPELETALAKAQAREGRRRPAARVVLSAVTTIRDAKRFGEMRVFEVANEKIDAFLQLAAYDWASTHIRSKPMPFLEDMVRFLNTTVTATLASLPTALRASIYLSVFAHIGDSLKAALLEPRRLERITPQAIESFNLDVLYLESCARQLASGSPRDALHPSTADPASPVILAEDDGVSLAQVARGLVEIRQLVDLARSDTPAELLDAGIRAARYSSVTLPDAIRLFEGLRGDSVGLFSKTADRKRRERLEAVLRQLKLQGF